MSKEFLSQDVAPDNRQIAKAKKYWMDKLSGELVGNSIPYDFARTGIYKYKNDTFKFRFPDEVFSKLVNLSRGSDQGLNMILTAGITGMLYKYTGNEDITVITPIYRQDVEGKFINTILLLKNKLTADMSFKELLLTVRQDIVKANDNQNYPVEKLLDMLGISFSGKNFPLLDTVILLKNIHDRRYVEHINANIIFSFQRSDGYIEGTVEFNSLLYRKITIERAVSCFINFMLTALENANAKIADMEILNSCEKQKMLFEFNDTKTEYARDKTIHEIFEEQVQKTPEKIALEFKGKKLTYRELNINSNKLAVTLREKGVKPDSVVGIMAERSMEMIIGILGILKAGGAYLPIDPDYPEERIKYMLEDSKTAFLLIQKKLAHKAGYDCSIIEIDDETICKEAVANPENINKPEDLIYIIYTSGSTGKPKGTMISHRGAVNYICWANKVYVRGEELSFPLYSSISFDLTVTSIFTPLISGNKIIIYSGDNREFPIKRVLEENKAGIVKLTPTHLQIINELNLKSPGIKRFIVGGEDLKTALAQRIDEIYGGEIEIFNEYGPTEATVGCMIYKYKPGKDLRLSVPIGVPADNVQIYILDKRLKPAAAGVEGELYISGDGLARGYLNNMELTEDKFIPNPFIPGERMYRTGDLARWLPDGNIEFAGRIDQQVKIRGFRIETGEIESEILKYADVTAAVVEVKENLNKPKSAGKETYCLECGLPKSYPGIVFDTGGVCNLCREYKEYKEEAKFYFKTVDDLKIKFGHQKAKMKSKYDCISLFSGGKDSSYILYKLVDMGLNVLAFTFDNGFISKTAFKNIENVVNELKIDNIIVTAENMNQIFVENLKEESNVCNSCFKTLLTLSTKLAYEKGIKYIVTGLSRGQIYETRLSTLFREGIFDPEEIDKAVLNARKAYHGKEDYVSALLDINLLKDKGIFDEVEFIDFYRYCDVTKKEIYNFLKERSSVWSKPSDTGFCSSNCRVNDVGIYIHCKERGYHNYAQPTCWEVRIKHLSLEEGRKVIEGEVDIEEVKEILKEIGYDVNYKESINSNRYLAAYYVSNRKIPDSELRMHLSKRLPEYMMPSYFVQLEKMPLTANGKVDRKALPQPETGINMEVEYTAPGNEIEEKLAGIWQEVLGMERVGINDNFIKLGGDSIKAIQVSARLHKFGLSMEIRDIFKHPKISELSNYIKAKSMEVSQGIVEGEVELIPVQKWFFEKKYTDIHHFNQSVMLHNRKGFDENIIRKVFDKIVEHHDALRMVYRTEGERIIQYNRGMEGELYDLKVIDLVGDTDCSEKIEEEANMMHSSIDLCKGPLVKLGLFKTAEGDHLLIIIHHLTIDGVSWRILFEDLAAGYAQAANNEEISLVDKTDSFKKWSEKLQTNACGKELMREEEYWDRLEETDTAVLPKDNIAQENKMMDSNILSMDLSEADTKRLLSNVNRAYNTEINDILLTALGLAVKEWTGEDRTLVNMEGHGREEIFEDIDVTRTVGWFTTIYPVILDMAKSYDLSYQIKAVKESLRHIPNRGIGYGIIKYLVPEEKKGGMKFILKPEISFNYLGQIDSDVETAMFSISPFGMGQAVSPKMERRYVFDINGMIAGGKLVSTFNYNKYEYNESTVLKLIEGYKKNLLTVINHCEGKKEAEISPSDLIYNEFSIEEFQEITELMKNKIE